MIKVTQFAGKNVGVLGLGRTGIAVVTSLLDGGAKIRCWDDTITDFSHIIASDHLHHDILHQAYNNGTLIINPPYYQENWIELAVLVVSPGISNQHPVLMRARQHHILILSDFDLLYNCCPQAKYIGITGTNGKSTTTALINHILSSNHLTVAMGGNIGIPALSLPSFNEGGYYVLESSSFQLDLITEIKFHIAIFLNLTPDHLDRHHTMENYQNAKFKIFDAQEADDYAILSVDTPVMSNVYQQLKVKSQQHIVPISTANKIIGGVAVIDNVIYDCLNNIQITHDLGNLKYLKGIHNAQNIAASYAACRKLGMDSNHIINAILSFTGLEHRMELILEYGELQFINDSKATNTNAASQALSSYDDIIWIAGGIFKEDNLDALTIFFNKIKHVYLIGRDAGKFAEILSLHQIPHTMVGTLEKAVLSIKHEQLTRGTVLLSPACASLDQWKNYEHRGLAFKNLVLDHFEIMPNRN